MARRHAARLTQLRFAPDSRRRDHRRGTRTIPKRAKTGNVPTFDVILLPVKSSRRRQAPNTQNGTVPPRLIAYGTRRPREYLTVKEVDLLKETARDRGR